MARRRLYIDDAAMIYAFIFTPCHAAAYARVGRRVARGYVITHYVDIIITGLHSC